MQTGPFYPTPEHSAAAKEITAFWTENYPVEAVLLVNSCARGKATPDSCLDMVVLARPEILAAKLYSWEEQWELFNRSNTAVQALQRVGKYSVVHLDISDGVFELMEQDEAAGPDSSELGPGNYLAYSFALWQGGDYLARLKQQWLPYYDEAVRRQRLAQVRFYCLNNLHHIPLYIDRGLYFQAFDRLYNAYQEFLQALFIARRTYPIAYNKWIKEQLVEILVLPELYEQISHLLEINSFVSSDILLKGLELESLLEEYAPHIEIE